MSASAPLPGWYVVQCKPQGDWRALEHLERQGFECYLPVFRLEARRRGHLVEIREPLFPRYLFIRLDAVEDNWYPIRSTRGVTQIVRSNHRPVQVRDEIIDSIRARLANGTGHRPYIRPGEHVRITEGSFAGIDAIFLANVGDERVILLLNILQQDQQLVFPLHSVRRIA
jgi:transcriptional antiterminator RfaH